MTGTGIRAVPQPSLESPELSADGFEWHKAPALVEVVADPPLV